MARAPVTELTDYIALALEILRDVGLPATGVTSPWSTGDRNESEYAQAIGAAQWRVHGRHRTWYFRHCLGNIRPCPPSVSYRNSETGQVVVSIPATTNDPLGTSRGSRTKTPGFIGVFCLKPGVEVVAGVGFEPTTFRL